MSEACSGRSRGSTRGGDEDGAVGLVEGVGDDDDAGEAGRRGRPARSSSRGWRCGVDEVEPGTASSIGARRGSWSAATGWDAGVGARSSARSRSRTGSGGGGESEWGAGEWGRGLGFGRPGGYGGVWGRPGPAWLAAGPTGPVGGVSFSFFSSMEEASRNMLLLLAFPSPVSASSLPQSEKKQKFFLRGATFCGKNVRCKVKGSIKTGFTVP